MVTGSLSRLIVESEFDVVQPNPGAWEFGAAIEFDSHFSCGCAVDVLVGDVADFDPRYLTGAAFVAWAVVLVDNDGVLHILHHCVLE